MNEEKVAHEYIDPVEFYVHLDGTVVSLPSNITQKPRYVGKGFKPLGAVLPEGYVLGEPAPEQKPKEKAMEPKPMAAEPKKMTVAQKVAEPKPMAAEPGAFVVEPERKLAVETEKSRGY